MKVCPPSLCPRPREASPQKHPWVLCSPCENLQQTDTQAPLHFAMGQRHRRVIQPRCKAQLSELGRGWGGPTSLNGLRCPLRPREGTGIECCQGRPENGHGCTGLRLRARHPQQVYEAQGQQGIDGQCLPCVDLPGHTVGKAQAKGHEHTAHAMRKPLGLLGALHVPILDCGHALGAIQVAHAKGPKGEASPREHCEVDEAKNGQRRPHLRRHGMAANARPKSCGPRA
mmetsp:Transcript_20217/g.62505  ORF Transcript_20217/g.62505 Transcript_20217/m.62505 type:complete len:228 (-) Transcript_20217:8-691(-)